MPKRIHTAGGILNGHKESTQCERNPHSPRGILKSLDKSSMAYRNPRRPRGILIGAAES